MNKLLLLFALLLPLSLEAQTISKIPFAQLEKELTGKGDSVTVVNFWATWCKPCLEELPHFKEATEKLSSQKVKFIYVSLDFESKKQRAQEVLIKHNLKGKYFLLEGDANEWINKLDPNWQGDIPYTLVVKPGGERYNASSSFDSTDELINFITKGK